MFHIKYFMIGIFCTQNSYNSLKDSVIDQGLVTKNFISNKYSDSVAKCRRLFNNTPTPPTSFGNFFLLFITILNLCLLGLKLDFNNDHQYASIYDILVHCVYKPKEKERIVIVEWLLYIFIFFVINMLIVLLATIFDDSLNMYQQWNTNPPVMEIKHQYSTLQDLRNYFSKVLIMDNELKKDLLRGASNIFASRIHEHRYTMLFTGPPGVGKTESAKKIIAYTGGGYLVKLSNLIRLSPDMIHNIFQKLFIQMKVHKKTILFDDGELGLLDRLHIGGSNSNNTQEQLDNQKLSKAIQVIVTNLLSIFGDGQYYAIFTTNISRGESFDQAYSRRFTQLCHFFPPVKKNRKIIINTLLRKMPALRTKMALYGKDFLNSLVDKLENCSGRDIVNLFEYLYKLERNFQILSCEDILKIATEEVQVHSQRVCENIEYNHQQWRLRNTINFNTESLMEK